jgi:hypothetical protein
MAGLIAEGILPFTRTPVNVVSRVLDATPIGALSSAADAVRLFHWVREMRGQERALNEALAKGLQGTAQQRKLTEARLYATKLQKNIAERIGRMSIGIPVIWLGYQLYEDGLLTAGFPTSASEGDTWMLVGKQPNSVLMPVLDGPPRWRGLDRLSPIGNMLVFGGHLRKVSENPELSWAGRTMEVGASIGQTVTEQTFLFGLRQFIDALSAEPGAAQRYGLSFTSSLTPNIIRRFAYWMDPTVREYDTVQGAFRATMPFWSRTLPPKIDQLGEVARREPGFVSSVLDPFRSRTPKDDPLVQEIARVNAAIIDLRRDEGENDETFNLRRRIWGMSLRIRLQSLIESAAYSTDTRVVAEMMQTMIPQAASRTIEEIQRELQREMIENNVRADRQALRRVPLPDAARLFGITVDRTQQIRVPGNE